MARSPRVGTEAGTYEGSYDEAGVAVFLGLRYAAAPVGGRRWAPPAPPPAFAGVRPADELASACPQPSGGDAPYRAAARLAGLPEGLLGIDPGPQDEDCLGLNVWTPRPDPEARLPVLVWIHGGADLYGSARDPLYHGDVLARKGVVVVSIHYRLAVLGFLAHPGLVAESPERSAGNYGAFHGGEISYVFGRTRRGPIKAGRLALCDAMMGSWTRFAATGDPNGPGLPEWPSYDADGGSYLELGDTIAAGSGLRARQIELWERVFAPRLGPAPEGLGRAERA